MEEAHFLTRFASKVTIIHRRDVFRASKIMLERAQKNEKIAFLTDTVVEDVYDVHSKEVKGLKLLNIKTGEQRDFPTSALFLGIGHEPNAKMFGEQLDRDTDGYLKTTNYVFTRVPGVFACGDVVDRRYRQAITALGNGLHGGHGSREIPGSARRVRLDPHERIELPPRASESYGVVTSGNSTKLACPGA